MSRVIRIRVDEGLYEALGAFCERHHVNASVIVRSAIRHLLDSPELYPELLPKPVQDIRPMVDPRTPAQIANWERYIAEEPPVDLEAMVAGMPDLETIAAQMPPLGESR